MKLSREVLSVWRLTPRHFATAFFLILFLAIATTGAHAALVSHWDFDEAGFMVPDTVGPNTGYPVGNVVFAPGKLGGGITLDGLDSYVVVYNDPSLNPSRITVSAWVKTTTTTTYTGIVDKWGDGYLLDVWQGGAARFVNDVEVRGTAINDGTWHLVTGTLGVSDALSKTKTSALYVDGVQRGSVVGGGITNTPLQDIYIGGSLPSTYNLVGEIDDVGIWDHGLWASEATATLQRGRSTRPSVQSAAGAAVVRRASRLRRQHHDRQPQLEGQRQPCRQPRRGRENRQRLYDPSRRQRQRRDHRHGQPHRSAPAAAASAAAPGPTEGALGAR